eukprot:CAMPEP_0198662980 /NCGR_PEP_ID=MMETSP1467-20131203/49973_1 /TAXON_ID=1462469 /ORGANISM="unid. sp., Strain CCMP2135" /LENGTH=208 /DNA_ID=CAMNT_0044399485 /DNA_START=1 /DNA_END=627 /DNA_ORIENTATION=+
MVDEGTPPPAVPASRNLRSFGSADFEESVWDEDVDEPMAARLATLKAMNREVVAAFAEALQKAATTEERLELEAVELKLVALHEAVGRLRVYEARESLADVLDHEIRERVEAKRRFRLRMASTLGRIDEMLADDDYFELEKRDLQRHDDDLTLQDALNDPGRLRRAQARARQRAEAERREAQDRDAAAAAAEHAAVALLSEESREESS